MVKRLMIVLLLISLTKSGEDKAIDDYCDAWKDFDSTGDWTDDWGSIDADDEAINSAEDSVTSSVSSSVSPSNIYDTYYSSECRRIRRPWNSISTEERNLYIDGLLELRLRGELKMELDEFVAVASVHDDHFGSVTHHDSDYLFWHGYLVWELESRIRNLGGKYKCFGMPYWDFTNEYERVNLGEDVPNIFQTGLGGFGDPNDAWKVNEYSWDVTTQEFWSPDHNFVCTASNDACPICSVKRDGTDTDFNHLQSANYYGTQIIDLSDFISFQQWMVSDVGLPHSIDNSYDPIWYLFHSFESYMQGMWVNCNDYDLIDINVDLYNHPEAFSPYCDPDDDHIDMTNDDCVGIDLDDDLYFNGLLPKRGWSYIHENQLNIKMLYSLPKWNVIYDLNDDDFFIKSGLSQQCKNKINKEWFILPNNNNNNYNYKHQKQHIFVGSSILNGLIPSNISYTLFTIIIVILFCVLLTLSSIFRNRMNKHSKLLHTKYQTGYGSV